MSQTVPHRCSFADGRHRITDEQNHQFVAIDDSGDLAVAWQAVSIPNQVMRAVTSEAMTEFISAVIGAPLKYVEAHPDHVHNANDKTLTLDMLCAADQSVLEEKRRLRSSRVTIQMAADRTLRHHFSNYVVSGPSLRSLSFHAEFHEVFGQAGHRVVTTRVVEELLEKSVAVAGLVTDDLFRKYTGLRFMTESKGWSLRHVRTTF
jgi:hypothetical protein